MKGILLLNGLPYAGEIEKGGAYVVCCDGAYEWARDKIEIDENVGDFDSLGYIPDPPPAEIFPGEKDFTDGEIALFKLIDGGAEEIEIYGGFGGREDHFIGNLHLLYAAFARGVKARMIGKRCEIFIAGGTVKVGANAGETFSLLPFGKTVHIMGSTGCKYAYPEKIGYGECRGISNVALIPDATVELAADDYALIIVNRGKV